MGNRVRRRSLAGVLTLLLILGIAGGVFADVIIDNGGTGTSYTGTWPLSGGTNPYGGTSLWSRNGSTYTFAMSSQAAGTYEVLMWWSGWPTRPTSVPVTISHGAGTSNMTVNQLENAGQWNILGTYYFNGSGSVTITSAMGDTLSTCADAVQFRFVSSNTPPAAVIDSITPNPATQGESVTFTGHGTDAEGTIAAWEWTSSIDGIISTSASFSLSTLSAGTHTITLRVQDNEGLWSAGIQRALVVGTASTEVIIDNTDSATSKTGTWATSAATDYYGTNSVWSRNGSTFTWKFTPPVDGYYDVSMWWTTTSTRSSSIPVVINHAGGSQTATINQLENAGQWNDLGRFRFIAGTTYDITITSQAYPTSTCADAVKFTIGSGLPVAAIDSIAPNPARVGEEVTFTGHGTGMEGAVAAYEWHSSIDGVIGTASTVSSSALTAGTHTISFRVQDELGTWSEAATGTVSVSLIIDNTDSATSRAGTWATSAATGYYGTDSLWSRGGTTFTWIFTPPETGYYDVSMWWTTTSTRSSSIPVVINHAAGSQTIVVNQLENASRWNSLGIYGFTAGTAYNITITSQAYPTSTCADALGFVKTDLVAPTASFAASTVEGNAPLSVTFTDQSVGTVTAWLWDFGDGTTSTESNPTHSYTSAGYYTVSLTVSNAAGSNTKTASQLIHAVAASEHIYLCDGYAEDGVFVTNAKIILANMGAVQNGETWVYESSATGRTFTIDFVNTPYAFMEALKEEGSHIIWNGHSNFGLGGSFAQGNEVYAQQIDDIRYVDDDRFTHVSTPMVSVKIDGVQYGQAYPNWLPVFKNGTSAVMPYTFSEGLPPYNYYLTYKLPGDSTVYKVELSDGSYLQRFPDSGVYPWYSAEGLAPDPAANSRYFIINDDADFNRCDFAGTWTTSTENSGTKEYSGYNYQYHAAGTGTNSATWNIVIKSAGYYQVLATWQSASTNATNAAYTIEHDGGYTDVYVDQTVKAPSGGLVLGTFHFSAGSYKVVLTDSANGRVIADSVRFNSLTGVANTLQAEFVVSAISGAVPLTVSFTDYSEIYSDTGAGITSWFWDFGDGSTSTERNPQHVYAGAGVYAVSLTITDTAGAQDTEIKTGLIAVGQEGSLRAQFAAESRIVNTRTSVQFIDMSSGTVTGWLWDFGDGSTSTDQNPRHTFRTAGTYPVTLTVTSAGGTDVKTNGGYVQSFSSSYTSMADNSFHYKPHFCDWGDVYCKTILFGNTGISDGDLKYARMFYGSCNSCNYYVGTFHRGIMYCTTSDSSLYTALTYLQDYLNGLSDDRILAHLNTIQDIHEMINFNLKPPSLR